MLSSFCKAAWPWSSLSWWHRADFTTWTASRGYSRHPYRMQWNTSSKYSETCNLGKITKDVIIRGRWDILKVKDQSFYLLPPLKKKKYWSSWCITLDFAEPQTSWMILTNYVDQPEIYSTFSRKFKKQVIFQLPYHFIFSECLTCLSTDKYAQWGLWQDLIIRFYLIFRIKATSCYGKDHCSFEKHLLS